jgi:hypothetical protein
MTEKTVSAKEALKEILEADIIELEREIKKHLEDLERLESDGTKE